MRFADSWQYPKPLAPGGPPVTLGTLDTPFGRSQVARYGDGWLPLTFDIRETARSIADIHAQMRELGRDPTKLEVSLFFLADEVQSAATLARARDTGATRAILRLPVCGDAATLNMLDEYARHLA